MRLDRYPPEDVFAHVPELADQADPVLLQLDRFLEDDLLFQQVRADRLHRYRFTAVHGRHSTPTEAILRLLVVRHLYGWSFEETERRVAESLVLRWFCRVYFRRVPDDTTLLRWAHTLQPDTRHALIARAAQLAAQLRVTRARKLRVDGTVVETTIHYPTDSRLLGDGVRVLTRLGKLARPQVSERLARVRDAFRRRTRSMQRTLQALYRQVRHRSEAAAQAAVEQRRQLYEHLIRITEQTMRAATAGPPGAHAGGRSGSATLEPSDRLGTARGRAGSLPAPGRAGRSPGAHAGTGGWESAAPGESGQPVRAAYPRAPTREAGGARRVWAAGGAGREWKAES